LAILKWEPGADPESPASYVSQFGVRRSSLLYVPGGNRTTAYYTGRDDYFFWRDGGMSWTVPYLAGLAALALQVDPDIAPHEIVKLWSSTAAKTSGMAVVNPPAFIEAVRGKKTATRSAQ